MKKLIRGLSVTVVAFAMSAQAQSLNTPKVSLGGSQQDWYSWIVPASIGTRSTYTWLIDHSRNDPNPQTGDPGTRYLGSIDALHEHENELPTKVFADWNLCQYANLEITWDKLSASAQSNHGADDTDGIIVLDGPIFTVNALYPNSSPVKPFAGIGIAPMFAQFDHQPWHEYGFGSVAEWQAAGEPNQSLNGKDRHIYLHNAIGFVATAGFDYQLTQNWSVNVYTRYMDIDTHYKYDLVLHGVHDTQSTGVFPMSNYAAGLGVKYTF
jgi:opacity protein-like surface antigen